MKILMVSTDFPFESKKGLISQGGGSSCVFQLVNSLLNKNIDVNVVTRYEDDMYKEILDIPVYRTKFVYLGFRESKILHSAFAFPQVIKAIRDQNPDIIHSHNPAAALVAIPCAKLFNKPHILTMHGPWSSVRLKKFTRAVAKKIEHFVLKYANVITYDSNALKQDFERMYGVNGYAIPNAIESEKFLFIEKNTARKKLNLPSSDRLILFTGRFVVEKGLNTLLDAFKLINKNYKNNKNTSLLLVGGGFDEHLVKSWLHKNADIKNKIIIIPFLPYEDMRFVYYSSDIFVLPSLAEGMSRSLMEAMACGLPCVATGVGGNIELLKNGKNGLIVKPSDSKALAKAIESILKNTKLAKSLSNSAKDYVIKNLSVQKRVNSFLILYKSLIKNKVDKK